MMIQFPQDFKNNMKVGEKNRNTKSLYIGACANIIKIIDIILASMETKRGSLPSLKIESRTLCPPELTRLETVKILERLMGQGCISHISVLDAIAEWQYAILDEKNSHTLLIRANGGNLLEYKKFLIGRDQGPIKLLRKDADGDFRYDSKKIILNKNTDSYRLLEALYDCGNQQGFLSYKKIDVELVKRGADKKNTEKEKMKRIYNIVSSNQLFRYAKINGTPIKNELPDGRELIETLPSRGLKLNNPTL